MAIGAGSASAAANPALRAQAGERVKVNPTASSRRCTGAKLGAFNSGTSNARRHGIVAKETALRFAGASAAGTAGSPSIKASPLELKCTSP